VKHISIKLCTSGTKLTCKTKFKFKPNMPLINFSSCYILIEWEPTHSHPPYIYNIYCSRSFSIYYDIMIYTYLLLYVIISILCNWNLREVPIELLQTCTLFCRPAAERRLSVRGGTREILVRVYTENRYENKTIKKKNLFVSMELQQQFLFFFQTTY